jgi:hypothetical protein
VTVRSPGAAPAETIDVLSPELVLVDPSLRETWQRLVEDYGPSPQVASDPASLVDETAAVRTLARVALDADVGRSRKPVRRTRPLRVVAAAAAAAAAGAIVFLAVDIGRGVDEPPAAGDVALSVATLGVESVPRELALRSPAPAGVTTQPGPAARRFVWAPVEDAAGYHVELFLGGARVFARNTTGAAIEIPAKWRFDGRPHELEAVAYDWYVWPIVAGKRSPTAVVQATLVVRDR